MKMKPSLYKFNNENDELVSGSESKTRYNYHLGLILDETPDFIQIMHSAELMFMLFQLLT